MPTKLCIHFVSTCTTVLLLSSNLFWPPVPSITELAVMHRYQLIAGVVEQRGIERIFENNPRITNALSFVARTGNTFLGSWCVAASSMPSWLVVSSCAQAVKLADASGTPTSRYTCSKFHKSMQSAFGRHFFPSQEVWV